MLGDINFLELSLTIVSISVAIITLLFYLQREFEISRKFMEYATEVLKEERVYPLP